MTVNTYDVLHCVGLILQFSINFFLSKQEQYVDSAGTNACNLLYSNFIF